MCSLLFCKSHTTKSFHKLLILWTRLDRRSRPEVFCKKGVLWSFAKFTGLRPATLLKNSLWHRCFPMNFEKFLRTPFFYRKPPDNCLCLDTGKTENDCTKGCSNCLSYGLLLAKLENFAFCFRSKTSFSCFSTTGQSSHITSDLLKVYLSVLHDSVLGPKNIFIK